MKIIFLKPCCIGDVIFATALLSAIRRGYPDAQIDWAVGSSAAGALREHPALQTILDTGPSANPVAQPRGMLKLSGLLRAGHYDLAIVPDRSPLLGLAALLSGIPKRAGLDSAGRGFTYTIRAPISPAQIRHEAEIYLDIARAMRFSVVDCWADIPPSPTALTAAHQLLTAVKAVDTPFIMVHPGGGVNAGMSMTQKRWPPDRFAAFADRLAEAFGTKIMLIGAESDREPCQRFLAQVHHPVIDLTAERLNLSTIGALASRSSLYLGNDNGIGHLAAASGARVMMIFGPSDPRRYAPFVPAERAFVGWKAFDLPEEGVSAGAVSHFDWARDGITVDELWEAAQAWLRDLSIS